MKAIGWASLLLVIGATATASAQRWRGGPWGGGYHASTAAEGAARGMADVIRSSGAANLMNSAAAKNYEDARKKYIDNRMRATQTYFEMKRVNKEAREAMRRPAPTQEQLARYSKEKLPDRLPPSQLDPLTGTINWPSALQTEPYAKHREALEKLYMSRATNGYLSPDQYLQVREIADGMMGELRKNMNSLTSSDRIAARKFIESLSFEANMRPI